MPPEANLIAIELLDRAADWDRLWEAHEWVLRMVPRFRDRVVQPPARLPVWEADPTFELAHHLRRERCREPGDLRALLDFAATLASVPLNHTRPLWEAVLLEGLTEGRSAYILKIHDSMTDRLGIELLEMLHGDPREPAPAAPQPALPPAVRRSAPVVLIRQLARVAATAPGIALRTGVDAAARVRRAAFDPLGAVIETARVAASLERAAARSPAPPSPLLAPRSLQPRFEALDRPLPELRAAGDAAGGSIDDAFVAALLGGLRRYHQEFGVSIRELPMAIPVSPRRERDPFGDNRLAGIRFAAPVGEPDPRRRIKLVREIVGRERSGPSIDMMAGLAPLAPLLPSPLAAMLGDRLITISDLQVSNLPGLERRAFMAGAEITRFYPFGALSACAATITLASHEETCCIGASLDTAAFTEPGLFAACLADGFDEVLAVGKPR